MSDNRLEPCPFCGSTRTFADYGNHHRWALCGDCGAKGPRISGMTTKEDAYLAWNRRPSIPGDGPNEQWYREALGEIDRIAGDVSLDPEDALNQISAIATPFSLDTIIQPPGALAEPTATITERVCNACGLVESAKEHEPPFVEDGYTHKFVPKPLSNIPCQCACHIQGGEAERGCAMCAAEPFVPPITACPCGAKSDEEHKDRGPGFTHHMVENISERPKPPESTKCPSCNKPVQDKNDHWDVLDYIWLCQMSMSAPQLTKSAEGERCAYQGCGKERHASEHTYGGFAGGIDHQELCDHRFVAPGPAPEGKVP